MHVEFFKELAATESEAEKVLLANNWVRLEDGYWLHPLTKEKISFLVAYPRFCCEHLAKAGWREVAVDHLEIHPHVRQSSRMLYQSPETGRLYMWDEARQIVVHGRSESDVFIEASEFTRLINGVVDPNFSGKTLKTVSRLRGEVRILELDPTR